MKANEAPEKIQLGLRINDCNDWEIRGYSFLEDKQIGMTEYIRKDALIKKACEFFAPYISDNSGGYERAAVIETFKNYMKGE